VVKISFDLCEIPDANRAVCADTQNTHSVSTATTIKNYFPINMLAPCLSG